MPKDIMPDTVINMLNQDEPHLMAAAPAGAVQRGADQISAAANDMFASVEKPTGRGR